MDLITSTVQPTTWDAVGGPGAMSKFPTGVYVDAQGVLRPLVKEELAGRLAALRAASGPRGGGETPAAARRCAWSRSRGWRSRFNSCLAAGRQPTEDMQVLAGLQRIRYVFVYPESGDLVLAGPAGDWKPGPEDILVSSDTGQPVVRLDDLVVVLRHMMSGRDAQFGCLITPRQERLARVQAFVKQSNQRAISPRSGSLARTGPRPVGQARHRGLRARSAHVGGAGDGRGRLSHEAGGHGLGSRACPAWKAIWRRWWFRRARRRRPWACCAGGSRSTTTPWAPPRTARPSPSAARG